MKLSSAEIRVAVENALNEDLGPCDATTLATVMVGFTCCAAFCDDES